MDKLRAMSLFCRVVEGKTIAAAARSVDMVPSALSKTLAALEAELGFKLLNRSTRRLSPTDDGRTYYEHCRQILQDIEDAEALGREGRIRPRGTLRVGMHPSFRQFVLQDLGSLLDLQPNLKIETVITNSPSAVIEEGLDLLIHVGQLFDSNLLRRRLGSTRSVTCASPAYLAAWGVPGHPGDLERHRAVVYGRHDEAPNTRWEFRRGEERHFVEVPVRLVSRDGVGLVDAAVGGCGLARPFDIVARPYLAEGRLVEVLPDWTSERLEVSAVMPPGKRGASAKVRTYLEFLSNLLMGRDRVDRAAGRD
jgi:LysR family transcriptional regulator for bpeEF and oprC